MTGVAVNAEAPTGAGDAVTASAAVHCFLDHCRVGRRLSQETLRAYGSDLADFLSHVGESAAVTCIGRDDVRSYARKLVDEKGLKGTTVRRRLATLKVLFHWVESEGLVPLSLFHRLGLSIRLPKRLPRALDAGDMRLLLRAAGAKPMDRSGDGYRNLLMHLVVVGLFTTGLRVGELVTIRLGDVCLRSGSIRVCGKGSRERTVYMPGGAAKAVLSRFLSVRQMVTTSLDRLLVTAKGGPVTTHPSRVRVWSSTVAGVSGGKAAVL